MMEQIESDVLQRLVPELEAEGYEVFLHPNQPLLPDFLGSHVPDAIARRSDKNVAIEIVRKSPVAERKMEGLAQRFENQKNWELRIVWITPANAEKSPVAQAPDAIRTRLAEIRELIKNAHFSPALLLAWATFEAIGRLLASEQFQRPQTPGRLVQVLAKEGYLTPTEADSLRALADKRNSLIHGELGTRLSKEELGHFVNTLDTLLTLV